MKILKIIFIFLQFCETFDVFETFWLWNRAVDRDEAKSGYICPPKILRSIGKRHGRIDIDNIRAITARRHLCICSNNLQFEITVCNGSTEILYGNFETFENFTIRFVAFAPQSQNLIYTNAKFIKSLKKYNVLLF